MVAECFRRQWSPESFEQAIQAGNVDSAWALLSSVAELSLFEDHHSGLSRAHAWKPRKQCLRPKRAPLGDSLKVVQLRKLRRRILQLSKTPDEDRLREKIFQDISALHGSFPALNEIGYFTVEHELHLVDQVLQQQAADNKESALRCWKDSLEPSILRQSSWIRRKAEKLCALTANPSSHLQHAVHPVQIVAKAEQDRLPRWKCPPALLQAKHVAALKCFLNHRDQLPMSSLDIHFCGKTLPSICKEMACKASGPDAWSAGDLGRLPEVWWEAFALLWTSVYKSGAIPHRWLEARVCLLPKADGSSRPLSILSVAWRIGARYKYHQRA